MVAAIGHSTSGLARSPGRRLLGDVRRAVSQRLRKATSGARGLPAYVIIGAQKSGTSSLHAYLAEHPRISLGSTKEIHFFDHAYHRGISWYRAHFPRQANGDLAGEATPYYLFHPLAPKRVAEALPEAKLIVILRNPIDRAVSHHNHEVALGYEHLPLEKAIARETDRLDEEEERICRDPRYRSFAHQHYSYLARGRYDQQLGRWFSYIEPDRFFVLSAEELFAEPARATMQAQEFLGLPAQPLADSSARNARSYTAINPELREELRRAFAPHNARLYALLGRDFGWG